MIRGEDGAGFLTGVLLLQEKDGNKAGSERSKPGVEEQAAAKDSAGSEDSEDDVSDEDFNYWFQELDMTSAFVSKARSKLEQKPKPEKEKKLPAKEHKSSPEKPKKKVGLTDGAWRQPLPHRFLLTQTFI